MWSSRSAWRSCWRGRTPRCGGKCATLSSAHTPTFGFDGVAACGGIKLIVFLFQRLGFFDIERAEHRAFLSEHMADLLLEGCELGEIVGVLVARRACQAGKIHLR